MVEVEVTDKVLNASSNKVAPAFLSPEIADAISQLMQDPIILKIIDEHASEFYLMDSAVYVSNIIFCMALSEYDQTLLEARDQNRMEESLVLIDSVINSRWFLRTSIILFLNKINVFNVKLPKSHYNIAVVLATRKTAMCPYFHRHPRSDDFPALTLPGTAAPSAAGITLVNSTVSHAQPSTSHRDLSTSLGELECCNQVGSSHAPRDIHQCGEHPQNLRRVSGLPP
ncbi:G-protein alpha subunit-domain-containing protein [Mycena galopus ATCC 62051]|nr:G-protein alpha subunit-domain-containing protein [Mycena galopus ATCC 62051]